MLSSIPTCEKGMLAPNQHVGKPSPTDNRATVEPSIKRNLTPTPTPTLHTILNKQQWT